MGEAARRETFEVFSWWTGGGEAAGLDAMIKLFDANYPDIEFINAAVAGGAGTNAKAVLASRLAAGDPPDSWQAHAGQEILGDYVAADQIEPLDALFTEAGLECRDARRPSCRSSPRTASRTPSRSTSTAPTSCGTNPALLAEVGVTVPTTWDEFFAACEQDRSRRQDLPLDGRDSGRPST